MNLKRKLFCQNDFDIARLLKQKRQEQNIHASAERRNGTPQKKKKKGLKSPHPEMDSGLALLLHFFISFSWGVPFRSEFILSFFFLEEYL